MFGRILYLSDNLAYVENNHSEFTNGDILNVHVIFEHDNQRILGEVSEVKEDMIIIKFLGEFIENTYYSGVIRKASLASKIRIINNDELINLIGSKNAQNFVLGKSPIYKGYDVCPSINDVFANHMCIFGNSGSGKSCGVARIVQNILSNMECLAYNSNLVFFDSFGEYKNAFKSINTISPYYNYKFVTTNVVDATDILINIPLNLLTVDDFAMLLQADKHSQLTILTRALKYARIFSVETEETRKYKNHIIAKAILNVLFSSETAQGKKDNIFTIIDCCKTPEFSFDTKIEGLGYSRTFSECFALDSHGRFGEEVLINEYLLKNIDDSLDETPEPENAFFTLKDFAKAVEFTLISEGFNLNKSLHDDAQIIKVRLDTILHNEIGTFFTGEKYVSSDEFITNLVTINNKKAQIININLESLDDNYAKSLVKIYSHLIFEFSKHNANRATMPFHLFLEEAHRYIQKDSDVFLLGYNIFDRIAKEGRKYGTILDIISQRPVDISETVVSQCSNFIIFKMTHALDIKYIVEMLPNVSDDIVEKMKILQPGTCVAFGSAFKIPMICKLEMPNPRPYSSSCDVASYWSAKENNLASSSNTSEMNVAVVSSDVLKLDENTNNGSIESVLPGEI